MTVGDFSHSKLYHPLFLSIFSSNNVLFCAIAARKGLMVLAGNNAANGPFTPIVIVVRNVIGVKPFNQLRGKGISLHSQVIKDFCKQIGADNKQIQGLIRLAKKNGEKLGFLS